jgi:hypothetical protein
MLFPRLIPGSLAIVSLLALVGCDSTAPKAETPAPMANTPPPAIKPAPIKPATEPIKSAAEPVKSAAESISFAPGTSSSTVTGSIVRGDRKIYRLTATKNQQMTIGVSSKESNAVFDLIAPDGKTLKQETTTLTQVLPSSGDYEIVVGGTRGNASYELTVGIK